MYIHRTVYQAMLDIDKIFAHKPLFEAMTGITAEQFAQLLPVFEKELTRHRLQQKPGRLRALGGGRRHTLSSTRDSLFFTAFYLRAHPTLELASQLFSASKGRICTWVQDFFPVLEQVVGHKLQKSARKMRTLQEFLRAFPEAAGCLAEPVKAE